MVMMMDQWLMVNSVRLVSTNDGSNLMMMLMANYTMLSHSFR